MIIMSQRAFSYDTMLICRSIRIGKLDICEQRNYSVDIMTFAIRDICVGVLSIGPTAMMVAEQMLREK